MKLTKETSSGLLKAIAKVLTHANNANNLPSIKEVERLRGDLIKAAQGIYDGWDEDLAEELNGGGICHLIVDAMLDVIRGKGIDTAMSTSSNYEQHVYILGFFEEGIYEIDIPHGTYETGGGFTWEKILDVTFEPRDLVISSIADLSDYENYLEEDIDEDLLGRIKSYEDKEED